MEFPGLDPGIHQTRFSSTTVCGVMKISLHFLSRSKNFSCRTYGLGIVLLLFHPNDPPPVYLFHLRVQWFSVPVRILKGVFFNKMLIFNP